MRRPTPSELAAASVFVWPVVLDVLLVTAGYEPVSPVIRRTFGFRVAVVMAAAHFLFSFRADPIGWAARRLHLN